MPRTPESSPATFKSDIERLSSKLLAELVNDSGLKLIDCDDDANNQDGNYVDAA